MFGNQIEILEEGLFDFNQELELVYLNDNKISNIHPNVFDHLTKLATLWLSANKCTVLNSSYNISQTQQNIKQIKNTCPKPAHNQILELRRKMDNLKGHVCNKDEFSSFKTDLKKEFDAKFNEFKDSQIIFLENVRNVTENRNVCSSNHDNTNSQNFSFNSPYEMCDTNNGKIVEIIRDKIVENHYKYELKIKKLEENLVEEINEMRDKIQKLHKNTLSKISSIEENLIKIMNALKIED